MRTMSRGRGSFCPAVLLAFLGAACSRNNPTQPKNQIPPPSGKATPVALTRSIVIPARVAANPSGAPPEAGVLTLSEGGDDELAEGPTSFDLMQDGGFVVGDPLQKRLAFYDAAGKFRSEAQIAFAAERVRVLPNNALSVVQFQTGDRYILEPNASGQYSVPRPATTGDPDLDAADAGVVSLSSGSQATVSSLPSAANEVPVLNIRYLALGENMVSVRRLGQDVRGRTYVAIEAAFPGQRVDVRKIVRLYSGNGENLAEITDIPLDYLVHPVDEFRIRDGVVLQLMPKASEVRINIWDTNARP